MTSMKWDYLDIRCGCCNHKMILKSGEWGCFYVCENNDINKEDQHCLNKMNVDMYEKILDKISQMLIEDGKEDVIRNYTGTSWEYKTSHQHYKFKVTNQYPNKMVISVINMKKKLVNF